jgi:hypothetical protein
MSLSVMPRLPTKSISADSKGDASFSLSALLPDRLWVAFWAGPLNSPQRPAAGFQLWVWLKSLLHAQPTDADGVAPWGGQA